MRPPPALARKTEDGDPTDDWAPARVGSVVFFLFAILTWPARLFGLIGLREMIVSAVFFLVAAYLTHRGAFGGIAVKIADASIGRFVGRSDDATDSQDHT